MTDAHTTARALDVREVKTARPRCAGDRCAGDRCAGGRETEEGPTPRRFGRFSLEALSVNVTSSETTQASLSF